MDRVTGLGRPIFAAVLLMIGGVLNIIYGCSVAGHIGAIDGERANPAAGEERAELQQVNPIRLKGVARGIPRRASPRPRKAAGGGPEWFLPNHPLIISALQGCSS
jgi:hypothetical protein